MRSSLSDTTELAPPRRSRRRLSATLLAAALGLAACTSGTGAGGNAGSGNGGGGGGSSGAPTATGAPGSGSAPRIVLTDPVGGVETSGAPNVDVRAYAVYDATAGAMLAQSSADTELPVGSLMKLLNARVAYDAGDPHREVEAPGGIAGDAGESIIGIAAGQTLPRDVLIRAMLKVSANDAARLLAIDIAGSEDAYAELMNQAARDLHLDGTAAVNATGLDADGQHSTADDLVTLAVDLLQNPDFAATVADPDATLNGETFANTNDLLGTYDGADGIKTGHTTGAGYCLLASATRDGRHILVAVLGAPSEEGRNAAATTLLDWAFGTA